MRKFIDSNGFFYGVIFTGIFCFWISLVQAQTPDPPPPATPATWIAKLATSIQDSSEAILTADEARALVRAYTSLEQRQVADIAVSDTHVYVLSPSGVVLLSKALK